MAEQLRFEEVFGDRRAVDADEGLLRAAALDMQVVGEDLLAGARFAGNEDAGVAAGDLIGEFDDVGHGAVSVDQGVVFLGDRLEHRGDEVGIRRQRDIFLGPGTYRPHRQLRVGADAAGHDRNVDALGAKVPD